MLVLGIDPSLTNFGWALHDTEAQGAKRCLKRGRFQTSAKTMFVTRYTSLREDLRKLLQETKPDKIGCEYPVFNDLYSEGMYGLFLYTSEAMYLEKKDVVFFSPLQVKAHARLLINRPDGWKMQKSDMVEAAKKDTKTKVAWNHNEADAYLIGRAAGRFWSLQEGILTDADLTDTEKQQFTKVHTFSRGKKQGQTVKSGIMHREDERFFRWSKE
jgi:Holliday junction resolvasome RuvABC endonuclease subunit